MQVVRYEEPDVRLLTWNHAIAGEAGRTLTDLISSVPGVTCARETAAHARALLARREILAFIATGATGATGGTSEHGAIAVSAPGDFVERNRVLNQIVESYRGHTRVYRVGGDALGPVQERIPEAEDSPSAAGPM